MITAPRPLTARKLNRVRSVAKNLAPKRPSKERPKNVLPNRKTVRTVLSLKTARKNGLKNGLKNAPVTIAASARIADLVRIAATGRIEVAIVATEVITHRSRTVITTITIVTVTTAAGPGAVAAIARTAALPRGMIATSRREMIAPCPRAMIAMTAARKIFPQRSRAVLCPHHAR
jgi:hypothetical protein